MVRLHCTHRQADACGDRGCPRHGDVVVLSGRCSACLAGACFDRPKVHARGGDLTAVGPDNPACRCSRCGQPDVATTGSDSVDQVLTAS